MTKIVVLDGYAVNPGDNPWSALAELGELTVHDRSSAAEVVSRSQGAEVVLLNKAQLGREALAQLPQLRGVSVLATGVNSVDLEAATERGIAVCNVPAYSTASVVQHTLALLLELCHRVGLHDTSVHAGDWVRAVDYCYWKTPLLELDGKLLGIIGYGAIGRGVADVARALGMNVCAALLPSSRPQAGASEPVLRLPLDELFRRADVISLSCPLTPETQHLVDSERLSWVKPSCLLINAARGGLVDEAALSAALSEGRLAGAAVDVLSSEPPSVHNPLLGAANCVITPHVAWSSLPARKRLLATSVDNVRQLLAKKPTNVVNPRYAEHAR